MTTAVEANFATQRPFSLNEAAKTLGVSGTHIGRLVEKNLIRAIWIGSRRFIPSDEIARVCREGTGR